MGPDTPGYPSAKMVRPWFPLRLNFTGIARPALATLTCGGLATGCKESLELRPLVGADIAIRALGPRHAPLIGRDGVAFNIGAIVGRIDGHTARSQRMSSGAARGIQRERAEIQLRLRDLREMATASCRAARPIRVKVGTARIETCELLVETVR